MMPKAVLIAFTTALLMSACATQKPSQSLTSPEVSQSFFERVNLAGDTAFQQWMKQTGERNIQVMFTKVDMDRKGNPSLTTYAYHQDDSAYFYPASTVKLPMVLLAYEKLNGLAAKGISDTTAMTFGGNGRNQPPYYNNPDAPAGKSCVRTDAAQILLVSDNEAFNRLYDFVGPEEAAKSLAAMGLTQTVIRHRLQLSQPEKLQRTTPEILFTDTAGTVLHRQDSSYTTMVYPNVAAALGKGYMSRGKLVAKPFDFTFRNRVSIGDLHGIILRLAYPSAFAPQQRFNITEAQRNYILQMMEMEPRKGPIVRYNSPDYWDTYCKFLFYGSEKIPFDPNVQIRNKVGDAYGFLTDMAWITNKSNGKSFLLTATISCNSDGIYNDDRYEYESVGFPFMKQLGRIVYRLATESNNP